MGNCLFCRIVQNELPASKVYEDDRVMAFLDIQPVNPGHLLVVPKEHFTHLHEMPDPLGAHLFSIAMRLERALRASGLPCDGTRLMQNNGRAAGQEVMHVHLHVIPRLTNDRKRPSLTIRKPSREALEAVAGRIRSALPGKEEH